MRNIKKILIFILIICILTFNIKPILAQSSIQVNLGVSGCNNNGICETEENLDNCPIDCAIVVPPPPPPGSVGFPKDIIVNNLKIQPNFTNAFISWNTSVPATTTLRWGETSEVKEGTLKDVVFELNNHKMEIINLKPGTMYYFTIESTDISGRTSMYPPTYFFTKFLKDTTLPSNPRNVKTFSNIDGINITWQNPPDENFSYIRIMRHEDHFRGNPYLGKLVYEGDAEKFLDKNVVAGKKYFYTLFSKNTEGKFSSGVAVSETAYKEKEIKPEKENKIPETPKEEIPTTPSKEVKQNTTLPRPNVGAPLLNKGGEEKNKIETLNKFFVHQYNQIVEELSTDKNIEIDGTKNTVVDTDEKTLPDDFMSVTNTDGNIVGQYLFSFNLDSGRYQSVISPLEKKGIYNIKIFRYKEEILTKISEGFIEIRENSIEKTNKNIKYFDNNLLNFFYEYSLYILILLLTLFLLIVYLIKRRKNQEKQG